MNKDTELKVLNEMIYSHERQIEKLETEVKVLQSRKKALSEERIKEMCGVDDSRILATDPTYYRLRQEHRILMTVLPYYEKLGDDESMQKAAEELIEIDKRILQRLEEAETNA